MSVNDDFQDGLLGHGADLRRYSDSVVRRLLSVLNKADADIGEELLRVLAKLDPSRFTVERLETMLAGVRGINVEAYNVLRIELRKELSEFAQYEASFQKALLVDTIPLQVAVAMPDASVLIAAIESRPFQGNLLSGYLDEMSAKKARTIRSAVVDGFVQGRPTAQIVRELIGTKAAGYRDGVLEVSRREANTLVRTAISHTAALAQQSTYDANADLIGGYVWNSTLDARTSSPCRIRDGKEYDSKFRPVGHSLPWGGGPGAFHFQCRSIRVPVIKSWKSLGVNLPEWTDRTASRASMDGQVPKGIDYGVWLNRQSAARQDDILGPSRGALLRQGGLSLDDMYTARGEMLSLDDLRKRFRSAFTRADL